MEFDRTYFAGKVAAVTGGASGVGLALCEELLESGAKKVVLADFNRENLTAHEARLNGRYPGRVIGVICNVTVEENVKNMVARAAEFGEGRLDLLINCAGAALVGKFTEEPYGFDPNVSCIKKTFSNDDWKKGFSINLFGAMYGCRHALPIMLRQRGGQIANIISGIAFSPMAYQSAYAATKAALCSMTLALRSEYWDYGIKFNAATPGTTATAIFDEIGGAPQEAQSPHSSAQRILSGLVKNDRIICGDDSDLDGSKVCFYPDSLGKILDELYLGFARRRKSGSASFAPVEVSGEFSSDENELKALTEISNMDKSDIQKVLERIRAYLTQRNATNVDKAYYAGKTAAVTGGASGVGLALCESLLEYGAEKIVLADFNSENLLKHEARLNGQYPGRVKGVLCSVADEESVRTMISSAEDFFGGKFDILINCAGIAQIGMFTDVPDSAEITKNSQMTVEPPERWEEIFDVNFYGPLYGCRAVLPVMLKHGSGQIVNIISGTAFAPLPYQLIYASSKAALNMLTLTLRYEYWDCGIKFNAATPGTVATALFKENVPLNAKTPQESALRILTGVAKNDRLICGDDEDLEGAMLCYDPAAMQLLDSIWVDHMHTIRNGGKVDYSKTTI